MNLPPISNVVDKVQSLLPKGGTKESAVFMLTDIGSTSIRAAVAKVEDDGVHILGRGSARQDQRAMLGGVVGSISSVLEKADEAMTQAADTAGQTSDQLVLGLGGMMVGGLTTLVHLNRPQPKDRITDKELQLMMERMGQTALAVAEEAVSQEMGLPQEDLRLINSAITSITIDGYPLPSPLDFSGKEIEFCLFNAFVSSSTLVVLQKMLADLNMDLAALTSVPYAVAQATVARSTKAQHAHWLQIDVGAGATSVTLVEQGAVAASKTFPLGGRSLTAGIARDQDISLAEAEQVKLDYAQGKDSESHHHRMSKFVGHEIKLWSRALQLALAEMQPDQALPEMVYLIGGASQLPELRQSLTKAVWYKAAGFSQEPKITSLNARETPGVIDDSRAMTEDDWSLTALAYFLQQRQQEDPSVATAYQKTLQAMNQK